jgi:LuxR family maltose regulon positive regulatory protein
VAGATTTLARADQSVQQHGFVHRRQEVAAAEVLTFLHQGDLAAAAHLAGSHELPLSQARVHLARKDASAALAVLESARQQAEARGWADEKLKVTILQAIAYHMLGQIDEVVHLLDEALALAQPGGFVRVFVNEGLPMAQLLSEVAARGIRPDYTGKLLAAFVDATKEDTDASIRRTMELTPSSLVEPLSAREIEVLQLIAQGLTNKQVADRLYLSLHTVKAHARNIYGKLGVGNRTQAVAKAKALGILFEP